MVTVRAIWFEKNIPVRCRQCGLAAKRGSLNSPRYLRLALGGVRHVAWEDCSPDEYVVVCPCCGEVESFDDAIICAECLEYPCVCLETSIG